MKKIYLMGLTAILSVSVNAQSTIKVKRGAFSNENTNSTSRVQHVNALAGGISCSNQYTAGISQVLTLTLTLSNTDNEYGDSLSITLPTGFTVNSALPNDSIGVSESPGACLNGGIKEPFRGIFGQAVVWGDNDNCYGGLPSGTNAGSTQTISINVTVGVGVTGPQTVNFFVSGDGFAAPADLSGSFILNPAGTVVLDMQTKLVAPSNITAVNNCAIGTGSIIARVVNKGTTAQSNIPANYSVNGVASTSISIPGPILPGDSVTFTFPATYNFNASSMYIVKAWTSLASDATKMNDTSAITISNTIPTALTSSSYVNGIESAYDAGSINKTWIGTGAPFGLSTGTKHSGAQALFYTIPAGSPLATYEALNILPCVDLTMGDTYRISYWKKANTSGTLTVNGQSAIMTGTAQTAAAMTTVLKAYAPITANAQASTWTKDSVDYVAAATETRYFAIGGKGTLAASSDQVNVRIDDIMIVKVNGTSGIKTITNADLITIFPNPTSGILNINTVEANSSLEVYNVIGDKVYINTLVKGNNSVDLSNFANGAYFVKLISNGQMISKKIILSK